MPDKTKHLSTKRNLIIILVVVIIGCFGFYYFDKVKPYNDLLTSANKAITTEDYDNAIKFYTEAETYKKTSDIDKKIQFTGILKKSKENYDSAMQKMKGKDYLSAIDIFKKVDKQDNKRYSDTQNKINECKKLKGEIDADQKQNSQAKTAETSSGAPAANGPVTFDQALSMVVKAEFPDGKYAVIKETGGTNGYVSLDSTAVVKNKVKCQADIRGREISYDKKEVRPTEIWLKGSSNPSITKNCYEFFLALGGHIPDGYYVEASTGKMYKHEYGNSKSIN